VKPFAVALASALGLHAGVAAGVWSAAAHTDGSWRSWSPEPAIEVDEYVTQSVAQPAPERTEHGLLSVRQAKTASQERRPRPQAIETALEGTTAVPLATATPSAPAAIPHFHITATAQAGAAEASAGAGAAAAPPNDQILPESVVTERAIKIGGDPPAYPPDALAQHVEIDAPLAFEIVVDTSGRVASARPFQHAGFGFDEAAMRALRAYRFSPAKRHGEAVRVRMRWTVEFHLR